MRPKVLMACIHPYTSTFQVGSQHLARQFIKNGYDVGYLSAPLSPFHIFKKDDPQLYQRFDIYKKGGEYSADKRLWQYVPFSLFTPAKKPFLENDLVLRNWKNACFPNLLRKLSSKGFSEVDVFYFDNILSFYLLEDIKCRKSVLRIMDKHSGFPAYPKISESLTKDIRKTVDVVVYSAKSLEAYARGFATKDLVYMPNGIDLEAFMEGSKEIPEAQFYIKKPIAVYVGAIEAWFDSELVAHAADKLRDISFLIIGPKENADHRLAEKQNVHLIGTVEYNHLQKYLSNCDVGIIPFNVEKFPHLINSVNPLKLYEYMACGLPVVSTEWHELRLINSPAALCNSPQQFVESISDALKHEHDTHQYRDFAEQNCWDNSFSRLKCYLQ